MQKSRSETIKMLSSLQDSEAIRRQRMMDAKRKYDQLLQELEMRSEFPQELLPYLHFYKLLARKDNEQSSQSVVNRLKLWIPDTIVLNDRDMPNYWLYSDARGFVFRTDTFTSKNVISKLANYTSPDELVAVIKKQGFRNLELVGNDVKLVCCRELLHAVQGQFSNRVDVAVIQKFVKSNGPKAFICRAVWRKERNPIAFIVTNKEDFYNEGTEHRYITNANIMGSCTIVKTCRGKYVDETIPYVKNLLTYLQIHLGITFSQFAADFIKDESGIWWLINVKSYIIDKSPAKIMIKGITHHGEDIPLEEGQTVIVQQTLSKSKIEFCQKQKMCKYCEQLYPEQQLNHKMTLKMIIQTDKHLYWRGKAFPWIERSDVTNLETSNLYQEHKVCKQWYNICISSYNLYKVTEQLIELQLVFNRMLQVPTSQDTNQQMLTLKANEVAEPQRTGTLYEQDDVQIYDISATKQLIIPTNRAPQIHNTVIKQLNRFRLMVLIHQIMDVPFNVDVSKHYYIEYTIFDQKHRIKLDIANAAQSEKGYHIPLNKMRLFYFFSNQRKGWNEYIYQVKILPIYLYMENNKIGVIELELQDFQSDRVIRQEYGKFFSVQSCYPILSWHLNFTLGLVDSGSVNVSRLKLTDHFGINLAAPDYCTCEPLPAEWMTILNQKKDFENQASIHKMRSYNVRDSPVQGEQISVEQSTKEINSLQMALSKEIEDYQVDEDEKRKKKRRFRPMYEL